MSQTRESSQLSWSLWIDDQVQDPDVPARHSPPGWVGCSGVDSARMMVMLLGLPERVSLDHDLGEGKPSGMDFLKWWFQEFPDSPPQDWNIHSANPVGADNMRSYLRSWEKACKL